MIQAFFSAVFRGLHRYAGWMVVLAWVALLLAILLGSAVVVSTSISVTYFSLNPNTPYDRALGQVGVFVPLAAILAAIGSLVAFLLRFRLMAALSVLAIWLFAVSGAAVHLSFIEPGPQTFQRKVGDHRFTIPWQFGPADQSQGFSVRVCADDLQGAYGIPCASGQRTIQLMIEPGNRVRSSFEMNMVQRGSGQMQPTEGRYDHQKGYIHAALPPKEGQPASTSQYYLRHGANDEPLRIVHCQFGSCKHVAAVGPYTLRYSAPETKIADWAATDRKFADLIDSWRTN